MPEFKTQFFVITATAILFLFSRICYKKFINILTNYNTGISDDELAEINNADTAETQQATPKATNDFTEEQKNNEIPLAIVKPKVRTDIIPNVSENSLQTEVMDEKSSNEQKNNEHPFEIVKPKVPADIIPNVSENSLQTEVMDKKSSNEQKNNEHPFEIVKPKVPADIIPNVSENSLQTEVIEVNSSNEQKKDEHPFEIVKPRSLHNNIITDIQTDDAGVKIYSKNATPNQHSANKEGIIVSTEPKTIKRSDTSIRGPVLNKSFTPFKK